MEDVTGAGMMARALAGEDPTIDLDDSAEAARRLYESYGGVSEAVRASRNARALADLGLDEDVRFCAQVDATDVVPELRPESRWPIHLIEAPTE